jgi:hypothetical protein
MCSCSPWLCLHCPLCSFLSDVLFPSRAAHALSKDVQTTPSLSLASILPINSSASSIIPALQKQIHRHSHSAPLQAPVRSFCSLHWGISIRARWLPQHDSKRWAHMIIAWCSSPAAKASVWSWQLASSVAAVAHTLRRLARVNSFGREQWRLHISENITKASTTKPSCA